MREVDRLDHTKILYVEGDLTKSKQSRLVTISGYKI